MAAQEDDTLVEEEEGPPPEYIAALAAEAEEEDFRAQELQDLADFQAAGTGARSMRSRVPEPEKKPRISGLMAVTLIGAAIFFDLLQLGVSIFHLIPLLGTVAAVFFCWMIAFFAQITFFLWFNLLGVHKSQSYAIRILIYMGTFIVELMPIIDVLPAITLGVVALIMVARAEDVAGVDVKQMRLWQLRNSLTKQVPLMRYAASSFQRQQSDMKTSPRAAGAADRVAGALTGAPRTGYIDQMKQRQTAAAMRKDISGTKFTEDAERVARRSGSRQTDARIKEGDQKREQDQAWNQF